MKIKKSFLMANPGFDVAVAEFAEKLRHWIEHMKRVEADAAAGDRIPPIERHTPYAKPQASEIVEACVDDAGNVVYELEDDSDAILRQQKDRLIEHVSVLEEKAKTAILPPIGKRRLFSLRERQIAAADNERAVALIERQGKPGFFRKLLGTEENLDVATAVAEQRPEADTLHLQQQEEQRQRIEAVVLLSAQAMHDIEDLTAETIGAWQAPDFSGV